MAHEEVPFGTNSRIFETCSQLVTLIRYQLGEPDELLNNFCFRDGAAFGMLEHSAREVRQQDGGCRHGASFAWVLLESRFAGGVPEMKSPVFNLVGCVRRWQLVANYIRGSETIPDEVDIHLQCLDVAGGPAVQVDVEIDLHRGTEKIGDETVSHVYFDPMVSRHVIFTGSRRRRSTDDEADPNSFADAYTAKGKVRFKNCCEDIVPQVIDYNTISFYD